MSNRVTILNETIGGDPNGNYTMGVTDIHSDDETWLRGVWPTNKEVDGKNVQGGVIGYVILGVDTAKFK
ncbi:hypothetical protein MPH_08300 [Macrophomina phaseolina MS6]|uniref:Uncharacterized protein n=1 Tax=Macrophomina phaseolina (strain MS6) TaxID=1126212 RepID=K2QX66_MACPH|nr:hypothetical protein MPH_08300 [Macrophomina phaseolina MS6]